VDVSQLKAATEAISRAGALIRAGSVVAFPTETVYGLGANALNSEGVAAIFQAKGRPSSNPLIVHIAEVSSVGAIVREWPKPASLLAERFWPGPLSLVLEKQETIPDIVTGGRPTVAIRVPAHPVAQALLRAAGVPIAAPSANRSEQLSPTLASHVLRSLDGRIPMILDGGATRGGIESTVVSISGGEIRLLRPGLISPAEIEAVVGPIVRDPYQTDRIDVAHLASPGLMLRHYAPAAPLQIAERAWDVVYRLLQAGESVGCVVFNAPTGRELADLLPQIGDDRDGEYDRSRLVVVVMPGEVAAYSALLYAKLHELDAFGVTRIVVEALPHGEEWMAVRDRLSRAATIG